jgi:uncharacterized protein
MKRTIQFIAIASLVSICALFSTCAKKPEFKVLALYSTNVESDHVVFAFDAIEFLQKLALEEHFTIDTTSDWSALTKDLGKYRLVIWINEFPKNEEQRLAFRSYMEHGGAWLGFHVAAYNDKTTQWPWLLEFLGGGVFYRNNWPCLPARLIVEDTTHAVTRGLPSRFVSPVNEWYQWKPSPRLDKNIEVLVSLDPSNYPLGVKDIIPDGDLPVVWTNKNFKMVYMNMGHGDLIFTEPVQNALIANAVLWLTGKRK